MVQSKQFIQQRKLCMALPVLAIPFLVLIFWALEGGTAIPAEHNPEQTSGFNIALPEASFGSKEIWDKLSLYEQAQSDSAQYEEARENDPYFDLVAFKSSQPIQKEPGDDQLINAFPQRDRQQIHEIEAQVQAKIDQLYTQINKSSSSAQSVQSEQSSRTSFEQEIAGEHTPAKANRVSSQSSGEVSPDVARMEQMMQMFAPKTEPDPEMQQIQGVLETILDIQHPERVKERIETAEAETASKAFAVDKVSEDNISLLSNHHQNVPKFDSVSDKQLFTAEGTNAFYGLDDRQSGLIPQGFTSGTSIAAVVHDTQELVAGANIKLRVTDEVAIAGIRLPKDQFIYGTCEISGERLTIKINSIRLDEALIPVALSAYDLDGLEGVYIPGAITRDAAKQATGDAMQSMQFMSMNPSIGAQAASAGIEAAKGLISKKSKLVKVTVKAGYQVLLRDASTSFN
jgi:conjugative transposon TraM protein